MGRRKFNRICIVCGKNYEYCSHCGKFNPREKWRYLYCSENCREIWKVCNGVENEGLSIAEAKQRLSKCDVPSNDVINKDLVPIIERINKE